MQRTLAFAVLALWVAAGHAAVKVQAFSPQGTVKDVRQVAVRFSAPIVRFGDPRLPEPFDIDCDAPGASPGGYLASSARRGDAPGRARWADGRNWVYDFEADLPAGVRCRFTLKKDLKSLAGEALSAPRQFEFDTGGPAIRASMPYQGSQQIDEDQIFILALDAPATPESIAAQAYCAVTGIEERVPLKVLSGAQRKDVLALRRQLGYQYFRVLWKDSRESIEQVTDDKLDKAEELVVVARCGRTLPPDTHVDLVWGKGVATASGIATRENQTLPFQSRPAFTASFSCERVNAQAACLPMRPLWLSFTAPIARDLAQKIVLKDAAGKTFAPKLDDEPGVTSLTFPGPFAEHAKLQIVPPADLVDDAGRPLANRASFPLAVATDEYPPLAKFGGSFGILEASDGGVLPVTLRNLEPSLAGQAAATNIPGQVRKAEEDAEIAGWLQRIKTWSEKTGDWEGDTWHATAGAESIFGGDDKTQPLTVAKPLGEKEFEVVGIPLVKPGFYVVELKSPKLGAALLGDQRTRHVATTALVTNLSVHFKWGRESSLAFVTTLGGAQPVAGAAVRISDYCKGNSLWQGTTGADGIARIAGTLPKPQTWGSCDWGQAPLMVSARKDDDLSFTLTTWADGISPGDFQLPFDLWTGPGLAHTVLDRALFRAGETVSMKHFVRQHTGSGFAVPGTLPDKLRITHQGSDTKYDLAVTFDGLGTAETKWPIPQDAKLGVYDMALMRGDETQGSGSFRVEQYRVPTMRAVVQPPKEPQVQPKQVPLDLQVTYLAGGGAAYAPVKVRTQVQPRGIYFPDYGDFTFGGEEVKEGITQGGGYGYYEEQLENQLTAKPARLTPLSLDEAGAGRTTIPDIPAYDQAQDLVAELEYQDANGELLSTTTRVALWPARLHLGIRTDGWATSDGPIHWRVLALDLKGKPITGQRVEVEGYTRTTRSYRKRLIGGFYAYEHSTETKRLGTLCSGKTDAKGLLICDAEPEMSGELMLQAFAKDSDGNRAHSASAVWIAGGDDWWFAAGASDRMDLLPEQKEYAPGSTAHFQVRMPFRKATALVTVEREGVLDAFVTELSGTEPVIDVPIKDSYSPNVYVSVVALRGRVGWWRSVLADAVRWLGLPWKLEGGRATALVDLAKPAYKIGMAGIAVGWAPHRLGVKVQPDKDTYRIRDKSVVTITATAESGAKLPAGAEIALAAVDEGLLELMPNDSWKLLEAMMQRRGVEVVTSTAQMQVVGRRHYGRKAAPPGGGGGHGPNRELLDTLLLWQARVPLDAKGQARVEVPLNDALTAFKIVAIAHAGAQMFGTGSATIRTTQDLVLTSGLPAQVREGDHLRATFTVRNASNGALTLTVDAKHGPAGALQPLATQSLELQAGAAREVGWDVVIPVDAAQLTWEIAAQTANGKISDRLRVQQAVVPTHPVRIYQATLTQLGEPLALPVARPADAVPGRGGIRVDLRARLGDGLSGVVDYMSRYPYTCLEQKVSQAIALRDDARWRVAMNALPSYLDGDGLAKYFAADWLEGSDTLTAYVLTIAQEAGWEIPEDARARMLKGLKGFVAGRVVRGSALKTADLAVRKLAAMDALARYAEAAPEMSDSLEIEPKLWPTSAVLDWVDLNQRIEGMPDADARIAEGLQILRSRLNFQGTTMGFSTEHDDALWWLMISADVNAVRAVLATLDDAGWAEDVPRVARGALLRQQKGHWNTTTANAWGVLAMEKFSAKFEAAKVAGATRAALASVTRVLDWSGTDRGSLDLAWPEGTGELRVSHDGAGKPWAIVQSRAALPLTAPLFTGYTIARTVTPVEQKQKDTWTRGDVARVRLDLEAQADMTWVVVDDPVPSGASILGTGLGRDSQLLTQGEKREGWVWPAFEERRQDAFRAYYALVPKGKWTVEYTVRFNASGEFPLPATRVEAMYAPEMFGEAPNEPVKVAAP